MYNPQFFIPFTGSTYTTPSLHNIACRLHHLEEVVAAVTSAVVVLHLKVGEGQVDRVTHRSLDGPRAVSGNKLNIIEELIVEKSNPNPCIQSRGAKFKL